jgi:hypothetical protein
MSVQPYSGGCLCGAVRYQVRAEPFTIYCCHCTDCQRRTGSAFAISMIVPRGALMLMRGAPVEIKTTLADGRVKTGKSCAVCSVRLWGEPVKVPDIAIVQPGTLDDTSWIRPVAHIWTSSAMPGTAFAHDAIRYEQNPPAGALRRLWNERQAVI